MLTSHQDLIEFHIFISSLAVPHSHFGAWWTLQDSWLRQMVYVRKSWKNPYSTHLFQTSSISYKFKSKYVYCCVLWFMNSAFRNIIYVPIYWWSTFIVYNHLPLTQTIFKAYEIASFLTAFTCFYFGNTPYVLDLSFSLLFRLCHVPNYIKVSKFNLYFRKLLREEVSKIMIFTHHVQLSCTGWSVAQFKYHITSHLANLTKTPNLVWNYVT